MTYKWIHPPIKLVEEFDERLSRDQQCVQDDLNQASVLLNALDIPREDWKMYYLNHEKVGRERDRQDEGDDLEDREQIYGFFLSGSTDAYSDTERDPIADPLPNDVFVSMKGGVYLPIGQHSQGSHHPGDWLISIEDYEAISRGIYTPAVYTCAAVREWDPHKQIRSWR